MLDAAVCSCTAAAPGMPFRERGLDWRAIPFQKMNGKLQYVQYARIKADDGWLASIITRRTCSSLKLWLPMSSSARVVKSLMDVLSMCAKLWAISESEGIHSPGMAWAALRMYTSSIFRLSSSALAADKCFSFIRSGYAHRMHTSGCLQADQRAGIPWHHTCLQNPLFQSFPVQCEQEMPSFLKSKGVPWWSASQGCTTRARFATIMACMQASTRTVGAARPVTPHSCQSTTM